MPDSPQIEYFLRELGQEAGKSFIFRESLVAEARAHLEDDVQARLELGATRAEAEHEAIVAFGTARAIRKQANRRKPRIDRRVVFSGLAVAWSWGLLGFALPLTGDRIAPLYTMFAAFAHLAFIVTSTCARRPQFVALILVLVPTWIFGSTFEASLHCVAPYPVSGEDRRVLRASVPVEAQNLRKSADHIRHEVQMLDLGYTKFLQKGGAMSPSRQASFTEAGEIRLFRRSDPMAAAEYWRLAAGSGRTSLLRIADRLDLQAQALDQAARASWWPQIPTEMAYALRDEGWIVAVYAAIHLTAWLLGQALRFRQRRNVGRPA